MNHSPTISLCMIVKDEETYLAQCLESVKDVVDEIIVVDTGSTDQTQVICQSYHVRFYSYPWEDDFSKARNYSISFAQSDWILILDADERIAHAEKQDFITFLEHTTTDSFLVTIHNFTGCLEDGEYSIHHSLRLFRNDKGFCFQGSIHEQVVSCEHPDQPLTCEVSPIVIHHFGYLTKVIDVKEKRSRNLPLLQKQLEFDPNNSFVLFNLGNEYVALEQYDQALTFYQLAKTNLDDQAAFAAYLYLRMVMCYSYLSRNQEAVFLAIQVQEEFPDFTDIVYCSGLAYYQMHEYSKALKAFDQCIRMGPSPPLLTFINGCSTFLPNQVKADIYQRLHDFESAIDCLSKAYQYKEGNTAILYELGHLLNQCHQEKEIVVSCLVRISREKEVIKFYECADILICEQLYEAADSILETLAPADVDTLFLKGKLQFYSHNFLLSSDYFQQVLSLSSKQKQRVESLTFLLTIGILTKKETLPGLFLTLKAEDCPKVYQVYQNIVKMEFHQENSSDTFMILLEFLEKLLKLQAFEQFEAYLPLFDQVNNHNSLLELGRLYERCGYPKLAQAAYFRSIKEQNMIDMAALDSLASGLFNV